MELWIRTQDKTTLIRSYEIYVVEYGKDSYVIRAKRTSHILGAYNSFERALEVLDEIQKRLSLDFNLNGNYEQLDIFIKAKMINGLYGVIYEMPED